jgi:hypothetical protein
MEARRQLANSEERPDEPRAREIPVAHRLPRSVGRRGEVHVIDLAQARR